MIGNQVLLNKINVFPVPDGDTGTNLSLSLGAALPTLSQSKYDRAGELLVAVADAMLDGARGNSGAILAQFFQGVCDASAELATLSAESFHHAVKTGSEYAHEAIAEPVEGTMLTVIGAYAKAMDALAKDARIESIGELLKNTLAPLNEALQKTTSQMDALKKAGVVDAGAKGFVELMEGLTDYVSNGVETEAPDLTVLESSDEFVALDGEGEDYAYRYCTECIVVGDDIDRRKLREALAPLGDSFVLAGSKRKAKVHIHVNDPQAVFEVSRRFGELRGEKADDLERQQRNHGTRGGFAVVTDSAGDISDEDMDRFDIHMVPCRIQFGDRGYLDKLSITVKDFYHELATNPNHPTTSQPAPGDFRRQYQYLASHYEDVISINLTNKASGTYEAARSAAARTDASGNIHVVNSKNASLGQGLIAVFAAECGDAGLSAKETLAEVDKLIPETVTFATLKNLDYAVKGGRVPAWVKPVANFLRVVPIIRTSPDGKISLAGCIFGQRNLAKRFAKHVAKRIAHHDRLVVGVGHAVDPDGARDACETLQARLPGIERLTQAEIGTAIGVHGGPGTLLISAHPARQPTVSDD